MGAQQWADGGSWEQERSCWEVLQAHTGSGVLPSPGGPWEPPGAHALHLWSGKPGASSHHCRGAQGSPKRWCPATPCSPQPGWGLMLRGVLGPSRPGCAWEPSWAPGPRVTGWEGNSPVCRKPSGGHPASGPAGGCHQWLPGSRGQRGTEHRGAPVVATVVVTAETLHFPLPASGPAAARCPGTLSSYLGSCCFLLE